MAEVSISVNADRGCGLSVESGLASHPEKAIRAMRTSFFYHHQLWATWPHRSLHGPRNWHGDKLRTNHAAGEGPPGRLALSSTCVAKSPSISSLIVPSVLPRLEITHRHSVSEAMDANMHGMPFAVLHRPLGVQPDPVAAA